MFLVFVNVSSRFTLQVALSSEIISYSTLFVPLKVMGELSRLFIASMASNSNVMVASIAVGNCQCRLLGVKAAFASAALCQRSLLSGLRHLSTKILKSRLSFKGLPFLFSRCWMYSTTFPTENKSVRASISWERFSYSGGANCSVVPMLQLHESE